VRRFEKMPAGQPVLGLFSPDSKTVSFKTNTIDWQISVSIGSQGGKYPKNITAEGAVYHEFGHAFSLSKIDYMPQVQQVNNSIWTVLQRDYNIRIGDLKTAEKIITKELSGYAATDRVDPAFGKVVSVETFAEAFNAVVSNGKQAGKLATGIIEEWIKTLSPEKQKIFSDLLK
jgi:hypothetical protein